MTLYDLYHACDQITVETDFYIYDDLEDYYFRDKRIPLCILKGDEKGRGWYDTVKEIHIRQFCVIDSKCYVLLA
jgi:hypothetical protein